MIKKRFQYTLLVSCILMLCVHSINAVGSDDAWSMGYTLEESFSDVENNDVEEALSKTVLFTAALLCVDQKLFFEKSRNKLRITDSLIRAPPTNIS